MKRRLEVQQGEWQRENCVATFGIKAERVAEWELCNCGWILSSASG